VTHPKLKYMNQMFGAHILRMKPNDAITVPEIATTRHPNLLVSALTIGAEQVQTIKQTLRSVGHENGKITSHSPTAILVHSGDQTTTLATDRQYDFLFMQVY